MVNPALIKNVKRQGTTTTEALALQQKISQLCRQIKEMNRVAEKMQKAGKDQDNMIQEYNDKEQRLNKETGD